MIFTNNFSFLRVMPGWARFPQFSREVGMACYILEQVSLPCKSEGKCTLQIYISLFTHQYSIPHLFNVTFRTEVLKLN